VQIVGCSFDKPAKNATFRAYEKFAYPLWSDVKRELALYYGAASSAKAPYAKRITVILEPSGLWRLHYPSSAVDADPYSHAEIVLQDLKQLLAR